MIICQETASKAKEIREVIGSKEAVKLVNTGDWLIADFFIQVDDLTFVLIRIR